MEYEPSVSTDYVECGFAGGWSAIYPDTVVCGIQASYTVTFIVNKEHEHEAPHTANIQQGFEVYLSSGTGALEFINDQIDVLSISDGFVAVPSVSDISVGGLDGTYEIASARSSTLGCIASDTYDKHTINHRVFERCSGDVVLSKTCTLYSLNDSDAIQYSVTLPIPELGNTESYDLGTFTRRNMSGTVIQVRKQNRIIPIKYEFSFLLSDSRDLTTFIRNTIGRQVYLVLHTGVTISGYADMTPITIGNNYTEVNLTIVGYTT